MMKLLTRLLILCLAAGSIASCSDDYDDSALWREIEQIKSRLDEMNTEIGNLRLLVGATETGKLVLDVVDTGDGYKIIFNDGSSITLNHGRSGSDGTPSPVIGVKQEGGIYYWTVTIDNSTDWLYDNEGWKIPVTGESGRTPEISVDDEGYWTIDGVRITDGDNNYIKASGRDGDSFFSSVEQTDTEVVITLTDGTSMTLLKSIEISYSFGSEKITLGYGQSATVTVTQTGVRFTSVSKPDGWKVALYDDRAVISSPARPNAYAEQTGTVSVVAVGQTRTVVASIEVEADVNISGGSAGDSNWQDW